MIYVFSILFAIAALTLLVVFSSIYGTPPHIVGYSIFGASLVAFYLVRTIYSHMHPEKDAKKKLHKLDHVMIYILTAATYMPVALILPQRGWGWTLFGVVWGVAAISVFIKTYRMDR